MPKRLTAAFVKHAPPGRYYDEHGLFLRVRPTGSRQWLWRGTVRGKRMDLGLGGWPYTTLAEARQKAFEYCKLSRQGEDPRALGRSGAPTFAELTEKVIQLHRKGWKGDTSEKQWRSSLRRYVFPELGTMPVDRITTRDVMRVLEADDFWNTKRETARRVRRRIGAVMKYAVAKGFREDNPAGDAIGVALPKNGARRKHYRSLPHAEVAGALTKVRASGAWTGTKLAIQFMVYTATRPGETRLATWDEIDIETATWTIPPERMKAAREHRVPLSPQALQVLGAAREIRDSTGLLFPSLRGKAMVNVTMTKLLRDLGIPAVSHGFRSSFRVWCGDSGIDRELAERALAHVVRNKVEAAYARGTMFERRRRVMADWARYVGGDDG